MDCHDSNSHWLRTKGFGKINESVRLGPPEYEVQSATMIAHNKSLQQSDDELRVQHLVLDAINRTGLSGLAASASFTAASRASTALVTVNWDPAGARLGVSSGTS